MDLIRERLCVPCTVIVDARVRGWCRLRYPGHPQGCPNYGVVSHCPPGAPLLTEGAFALLVGVRFDLGAWARGMKAKHPGWSDRQCRCLLYWQPGIRKALMLWAVQCKRVHKRTRIWMVPEGSGANIDAMMRGLGHPLEWPPLQFTWAVALLT